jgi:methylated-DNA-[protein]-cysteine S-methyltransferase
MFHIQLWGDSKGLTRAQLRPAHQISWSWEQPSSASITRDVEQWLIAYREKRPLPTTQFLVWPPVSPFAQRVYQAMQTIKTGTTVSYGQLATAAGNPRAARPAGTLCRLNPFPLFVPCHRVVAAQSLGGYAFGLPLKEALLAFEMATAASS